MITYEEALGVIDQINSIDDVEELPLVNAHQRILSEELQAKLSSPPYTNSAMDGFGIQFSDLEKGPLKVGETVHASMIPLEQLPGYQNQTAIRIMTGAPLPKWVDTVIPVEDALVERDKVTFSGTPHQGSHIRHAGEDVSKGEIILTSGTFLSPEKIMVAASFGYPKVPTFKQPDVHVFSTGDELVEPGNNLPHGAIINSSKYYLQAALGAVGITPKSASILVDDPLQAINTLDPIVKNAIKQKKPTLIITTGAVSRGVKDFIPKVAVDLGFTPLFHRVAIRPGKPVFLAVKDQTIWLGLPGNAISTNVGWRFFGRPLLQSWAHIPAPEYQDVTLGEDIKKPKGLTSFYRVKNQRGRVFMPEHQGSARLKASTSQDGFVVLPAEPSVIVKDTEAIFFPS